MHARKKGNKFEIQYRCKGYPKLFSERFDTIEEANFRIAEIELARKRGTFYPPDPNASANPTIEEFLKEYVELYGLNHWGDSYLSCSQHRINDYIVPLIGKLRVKEITPHILERFYNKLQETPATIPKGQPDLGRMVSHNVIEKIHGLLRSAFNQAIRWGYLTTNPANVAQPPEYEKATRPVWDAETALYALSVCDNDNLRLTLYLALGCSMRVGEILGLTWDCVDIRPQSIAKQDAQLHVNKELKRCQKDALAKLEAKNRSKVIFKFPEQKKNCSTVLVLKSPKTASSVRNIYIPESVAQELRKAQRRQKKERAMLRDEYHDYNLVISFSNGNPWSESVVKTRLNKLISKNNLPDVVFHSLRHSSASIKLELSHGNIKAVQGDTGHAQANMVTNVYAHSNNTERKKLAKVVEEQFFARLSQPDQPVISQQNQQLLTLLNAKPEMAGTLMQLLQAMAS